MSAIKFLNKSSNSLIREELLNYKLFYDLKVAAAHEQQFLKIYRPEVDIQGCDIVIEDNLDLSRKIQLKSRVNSKVKKWEIHKSIMLPGMNQALDYGIPGIICPTTPGGFVLIDVSGDTENGKDKIDDNLKFSYSYTDINIITLIAHGYYKRTTNSQKEALQILREIRELKTKKIVIKENLLVKLTSPISILKICGFLHFYDFAYNVLKLNQLIYNPSSYFSNYDPYDINPKVKEKELALKVHVNNALQTLKTI
jgi:hypothetical protein